MSPEQREELLERVSDLVGEHCNGFVFIADVDVDGSEYDPEMNESVMICVWTGGVTLATGLLRRATIQMEKNDREVEP
jgi:hypothetical protein